MFAAPILSPMEPSLQARISSLLSPRGHAFVAWLVLAVGLTLSAGAALFAQRHIEREVELRFDADARELQQRVEDEITGYEEVLIGLRALFSSRREVSRADFAGYVAGLDLKRRYPGFQNLSYAEFVPAGQLEPFEARVRRELAAAGGPRDFAIKPLRDTAEHNIILYIAPTAANETYLGTNINANPASADAIARTRDAGTLVSSGRLIRVEGPGKMVALAMRLAVYRAGMPSTTVEERRSAFRGSVGAGFRVRDLMSGAVNYERFGHIRFRLYDRGLETAPIASDFLGPDMLLFDSGELAPAKILAQQDALRDQAHLEKRIAFPVAGRLWEVQFRSPKAMPYADRAMPWLVLLAGILASALLFLVYSSITGSRRRAEDMAREITADLRISEASLAAAQRMAGLGNWSIRLSDERMRCSEEAARLLGFAAAEAPWTLQTLLGRVHLADREQVGLAISRCASENAPFDIEHRILVAGAERWVHVLAEPRLGKPGQAEAIHGTIMDISERKLSTRRKEIEATLARLFASGRSTGETMVEVIDALCAECGFTTGRYWEGTPDADADAVEALTLPLIAGETRLGAIGLFGRKPEALHPDVLKMLDSLATQLAQYLLRRRAEDDFKHLATHDALTGLPNRLLFGERVSQAIARAERTQRGLAVLFIDLDRFKNVNDTLGHGAGDAVLKACADRVARCLRDTDIVARISGDEFAVLVEPCAQPAAAIAVARKILGAIERPLIIQGHEIVLTGSIGISIYHEDGRDPETLLKHADIAMFRAKEHGRNNYQFYSAQMNPHSLERLALESALRRALDRGEFALHYQPKFDLKTGGITGVEALLRWRHAELGNVSPAQFIPIAEETGLIEPIGAWVLKEACEQAARWQAQGLRGIRVAVNLSARQFRNQKLGRDIRKCLVESGLDPSLLELELTESMVMQDPEQAASMLNELKSLGLSLSIDDFGTGYSSLAYLKRFPIDSVKVDRSFVKAIPQDAEDVAIVEAVIALAHSLRLRVVAEGVETQEQHGHLQGLGCDEMQGYYKSKPLPVEEITRFLIAAQAEAPGRPVRAPLTVVA